MDKLIESLITSGIPAIVIIVGLYFGKNLIQHFFNETIELKKKELEQENKNFQHQLDAKLQEFNIQFSSLHSERAIVVKELFLKILKLQSSLNDMFKIDRQHLKNNTKILQNFTDTFYDFKIYFLPNEIYFSKKLANKIISFLEEYSKITSDCINILEQNNKNEYNEQLNVNWSELSEKFNTVSDTIIQDLKTDFREILGVKN